MGFGLKALLPALLIPNELHWVVLTLEKGFSSFWMRGNALHQCQGIADPIGLLSLKNGTLKFNEKSIQFKFIFWL